jgi:hypothetical protein
MKKKLEQTFNFREDHLDDYKNLSAEQILIWLEEANRFFKKLVPPEQWLRGREIKRAKHG